jgi:hypothetical protein
MAITKHWGKKKSNFVDPKYLSYLSLGIIETAK